MNEKNDLSRCASDALAEYLQKYDWHHFYTATFSSPQRFPITVLQRITSAITRPDFCETAPSGLADRAIVVAERHLSGLYHAHGLVHFYHLGGGAPDVLASRLNKMGWSSVSEVRSIGNASGYCAKYLKKDCQFEWRLIGDKTAWSSGNQIVLV